MSRYMLAYDYPGEDAACQSCDDIDGIRRELVGDFADDEEQANAIIADLMRDGFWRDEGGRILLYQRSTGTAPWWPILYAILRPAITSGNEAVRHHAERLAEVLEGDQRAALRELLDRKPSDERPARVFPAVQQAQDSEAVKLLRRIEEYPENMQADTQLRRDVRRFLDTHASGVRVAPTAEAWQHEEDPTRVISAAQKSQGERDGGASASSVKPYSVPLVRGNAGVPARYVRKPEADRRISRGDDFAGDAWLDTTTGETVYTVVGFDRNASTTVIVKDGAAVPVTDGVNAKENDRG